VASYRVKKAPASLRTPYRLKRQSQHDIEVLMQPEIMRAVLYSYSSSAHTAVVVPGAGPAARLNPLPVLASIADDEMIPGRQVLVLLWPDGSGVVLGCYG
jgi:hypothetical protein